MGWHGGYGMMQYGGGMYLFGWLFMLLFLALLVLLVIWLVKAIFYSAASSSSAKSILASRYARGELTRKEYEQLKKDLAS